MIVRAWVMVGGSERGPRPPAERSLGWQVGPPPDAGSCEPGQWLDWSPVPGAQPIVLVCIDLPVKL